jgi:hypothetical protein
MKQFLSIIVLTLAIVLNANGEKFFWSGSYYEWAMVIAVDDEKKMATVMPEPFDAPDKTVEVPLRYVTKEMLDFYARPVLEINGPARKPIRTRLDKYKGVKGVFICGKIVSRLPDGALLVDCPDMGEDPAEKGKGNVRLTLLAPTKLVEGNVMATFAVSELPSNVETVYLANGGQTVRFLGPAPKPPYPFKQLAPLAAHR